MRPVEGTDHPVHVMCVHKRMLQNSQLCMCLLSISCWLLCFCACVSYPMRTCLYTTHTFLYAHLSLFVCYPSTVHFGDKVADERFIMFFPRALLGSGLFTHVTHFRSSRGTSCDSREHLVSIRLLSRTPPVNVDETCLNVPSCRTLRGQPLGFLFCIGSIGACPKNHLFSPQRERLLFSAHFSTAASLLMLTPRDRDRMWRP